MKMTLQTYSNRPYYHPLGLVPGTVKDVTASVGGSKALDGTMPHCLRSKASVIAPWTKEDVPEDLLGSWWRADYYGSGPEQVVEVDLEKHTVVLDCPTGSSSVDPYWLLTAYTRVPAP